MEKIIEYIGQFTVVSHICIRKTRLKFLGSLMPVVYTYVTTNPRALSIMRYWCQLLAQECPPENPHPKLRLACVASITFSNGKVLLDSSETLGELSYIIWSCLIGLVQDVDDEVSNSASTALVDLCQSFICRTHTNPFRALQYCFEIFSARFSRRIGFCEFMLEYILPRDESESYQEINKQGLYVCSANGVKESFHESHLASFYLFKHITDVPATLLQIVGATCHVQWRTLCDLFTDLCVDAYQFKENHDKFRNDLSFIDISSSLLISLFTFLQLDSVFSFSSVGPFELSLFRQQLHKLLFLLETTSFFSPHDCTILLAIKQLCDAPSSSQRLCINNFYYGSLLCS